MQLGRFSACGRRSAGARRWLRADSTATYSTVIARRLLRRGVVDGERLQVLLRGAKRLVGIFP
jgi:hypothetical protein